MAETKPTPRDFTNPYKARAYRSGVVNVADVATYDVVFNVEEFDTNNNFDTTTGQYTVPVTGYYQINAAAWVSDAVNLYYGQVTLIKNSTAIDSNRFYIYTGTFKDMSLKVGGQFFLTAGDVIKVQVYCDTTDGTSYQLNDTAPQTYLSIYLESV